MNKLKHEDIKVGMEFKCGDDDYTMKVTEICKEEKEIYHVDVIYKSTVNLEILNGEELR